MLVERERLRYLTADGVNGVQAGHRLLEDHGYAVAADRADLLFARLPQILALELNLAGDYAARRVGDEPQNRQRGDALAATAFTDQGDDLARIKIERGAIDGAYQALVSIEIDHEVAHAEERGHRLACNNGFMNAATPRP
jgi:hypothetical protein